MQIFLHIWAILGPLVGVLLGGWLTTKNQRKHWLLDNKRAEYRKVLTTLADCGSRLMVIDGHGVHQGRDERLADEAARRLVNVLANRLFIADQLKRLKVSPRFWDAATALKRSGDSQKFGVVLTEITRDIREAALKDFS